MSRVPTRALLIGALIWGVAEASLFFIVADVIIGWVALSRGLRPGLIAAALATLGATLGGTALFLAAERAPTSVPRLIEAGPAVPAGAVAEAAPRMARPDWPATLLKAAFTGRPYRVYAAAAPGRVPAARFAAVTPVVRAPRFLLIAAAFAGLGVLLRPRLTAKRLLLLHGLGWAGFYALYWTLTPG